MAGNILVSIVQSLALKQLSAFEGDFAAPAEMNIIKLVPAAARTAITSSNS
jgi:hypothetical protein